MQYQPPQGAKEHVYARRDRRIDKHAEFISSHYPARFDIDIYLYISRLALGITDNRIILWECINTTIIQFFCTTHPQNII